MMPDSIEVVNIYIEKADIYCGRGSALGNPFKMDSEADRDIVCAQYENYFKQKVVIERNQSMLRQINQIRNTLHVKGSVKLGCFCAPKKCHCETIKNYILKSNSK